MTECQGRYIVKIENVIYGLFPQPGTSASCLHANLATYIFADSIRSSQRELDSRNCAFD